MWGLVLGELLGFGIPCTSTKAVESNQRRP